MHIGGKDEHHTYMMTDSDQNKQVPLSKVSEEKDLGVTIDSQLKFTQHINITVKKQIKSWESSNDPSHIWTKPCSYNFTNP